MANRETRKEQYEDALFALLMDEMAQEDGEELLRLNEQLKQDPGAAVPEAVQRRCEKVIGTAFSRRQFRATGRRTARWLGRLLLAAILGVLLFTAAFAVSEDVRVATMDILLEVFDGGMRITFEEDQSGEIGQPNTMSTLEYHYNIALEWMPEDFELVNGSFWEDGHSDFVSYVGPQNGSIAVSIAPYYDGLSFTYPTQDHIKKDTMVNGHPAALYIANDVELERIHQQCAMPNVWSSMMIIWIDPDAGALIYISANNLTEDEMIRLAEGVHWLRAS